MSATRLPVLGAVRGFGTAHGYAVRGELVSWGAEEWADIKWGSVYHALRQLTKEGLLTATELGDPTGRVDYEFTEQGAVEFFHLLRRALRRFEHRPDLWMAGLALLPALPRAEAIELPRQRVNNWSPAGPRSSSRPRPGPIPDTWGSCSTSGCIPRAAPPSGRAA
ncbi:PadR family transcriptional regulator [Amycolatopsis cihanbeyliensis]|uniref:DNA-binding PadR family transcriptional regulator n=1 Tax=Amycolatopsis cihanbeyliensis TaxID=1128664 RepID=A0A542DRA4_AMYCI|nr:PadR family transcriptional regulator [Amycolatopsis cihanbeyliensis]TQJ05611.1 DNA-binding PadR family transcriptional regulator [Amycolatopsis cihanbeyliensis]